VNNFLAAGAMVTVVSPAVTDELADQIQSGRVCWVQGFFQEEHLDGAFFVVAATDDESVNERIVRSAGECGVLVCDASSSDRSQVIFGALHRGEDGVTVAVFTDGREPAQARSTRDRIAAYLGQDRNQQDRPGSD
jgi:siroheme synthase-like protein